MKVIAQNIWSKAFITSALALAACSAGDTAGTSEGQATQAAQPGSAAQASAPAKPQGPLGWTLPLDPKTLAESDRAAIMRAAGYRLFGKKWGEDADFARHCDAGIADSGQDPSGKPAIRDINGDGRPEVIVTSSGSFCHGMTGVGFTLLTYGDKGWQVLAQDSGIPDFYARKGIAWPDIEIGGPGTDCFLFLRWNGKAYVEGGTSLSGKICQLTPAFAKSSATTKGTKVAFPPIEKGFWAGNSSTCADEIVDAQEVPLDQTSLYYFDEKGGSGGRFEARYYVALGGNRYRMVGVEYNENGSNPSEMDITVNSRTSFAESQYGGRFTFCPISQVPRSVRADFGQR